MRDIALDCVELRVLRLHLVEHRSAPTRHDDFVAEFDKFEGERKTDAGGAAGDQDGAISQVHRSPFICMGFADNPMAAKNIDLWLTFSYW
jgi:hypothetical protein